MSGGEDESGWNLTESDPGVFTELLKNLGVPLIVDDLYSLDPETLASLQPINALIFLFKWVSPSASTSTSSSAAKGTDDPTFPGFFAHQVVNNACATLAVLNALGNIPTVRGSSTGCGAELRQLFDFTSDLDPQTRGLAITSSDFLRSAHNALSPPASVSLADLIPPSQREKEDAYHFVVYLPVAGSLYELDGLRRWAVRHGDVPEGDGWVERAREVIEARIETYPPGSLHFNLQALHPDPLPSLRALGSSDPEIVARIEAEEHKRSRWALENSLRRHNHVGLVHALLLALAKAGKLEGAKAGAKTKLKERVEKRRREGAMEED